MSALNPFSSTQFDAIAIGTGAAGLYAALCLPESWRVALVTKESLRTGASEWAQGGIAAAIAPDDSPSFHLEDTLKAGAGLCDRAAVEFLVENAPTAIHRLVDLGVAFDRKQESLALTLEAAHSHPRVLHAADTTGRAIVATLAERVLQRPNLQVFSEAFAIGLWINPENGRCQGVGLLCNGKIEWIRAAAVILATGGGGQVYSQTTNPAVSTGDGVALAWRAGAKVRDLEFFQFHPTALTRPGAPHFLISEAVRGEGAHLIDARGHRFAFDYHPKGELAPRDIVSRAIFNHLERNSELGDCVYLDLQPIARDRIRYRFPNIIQVCQHWGIDLFNEPIPVAPAAHYWMGGIAVDLNNQTSIPGLYAIGETASTGVHGANRLASNSLLECIVYAAQLAHLDLHGATIAAETEAVPECDRESYETTAQRACEIREQLQALMWYSAGILRSQPVLEDAIAKVEAWKAEVSKSPASRYFLASRASQNARLESPVAEANLRACGEVFNLLDIAALILKSAAWRKESRGGHYRSDFPETHPEGAVHTLVEGDRFWNEPVRG
ncbi:L-aspartate oxidase [Oscillatoria sp. FACHB-1406]|uniref:L-aspartate oxidase n=1 Tax=Oscillatoria sp. FACHB-1406 TaxID=2692846 RepID=UPI0016884986|nr:L-aspartate oxidase [Oscillatoria sp. FACHB-1406]MBD2577438.1 L-aspartate oxidase [Oscillatoria sp. FACHB-1406]